MATLVIMPRQGQSVESCVITEWKKKIGDAVAEGDILFSYETDKSSFDEPATVSGTLLEVFAEDGDDVPCLDPVCIIGQAGEDISALMPKATAEAALAAAKEDINAAIEEYCAEGDPMRGETALEEGLRIFVGSVDYPNEVIEAAEELKAVGDMSGLIATDEGYYIIQMVGAEEAGEVPYEEIKDTVLEFMISEKEENIFLTTSGEWKDEAEIKYYMDRLAYN